MGFSFSNDELHDMADFALNTAKANGATDCACLLSESIGRNVTVRMGKVDTLEHTRDKSFSVDVYRGQRRGTATTSDLTFKGLEQALLAASDIARFMADDEYLGLPDKADLALRNHRDLSLHHPWRLSVDKAIEKATVIEASAFDVSKNIKNSDGATVGTYEGQMLMSNSLGFRGAYPFSMHSISMGAIAQKGKGESLSMQREGWYSSHRNPKRLQKLIEVGATAAERAVARLGAKPISTRNCPVIFENTQAISVLRSFMMAINGTPLYKKSSFLLDAVGQSIWAKHISITEDPFVLEGAKSSPFDDEGVKVKARTLVKRGVLQGYVLNTYSSRRLNLPNTGHGGGSHNLFVRSTNTTQGGLPALLSQMGTGLLVTDMFGQGVNTMTGDFSKGVFGFWVENGVIAHPVEGITIAGNLKDMLKNIVAMADDEFDSGGWHCGSFLVEEMTVAGQE